MGGADLGLLAEVVLGRNRLLELAGPGLLGRQGLFSLGLGRRQLLVAGRRVGSGSGELSLLGLQLLDLSRVVAGREARDREQGGQGDDGTTDGVEKVHVGSPLRTQ